MFIRNNVFANLLLAMLCTAFLAQIALADPINWRNNLDAAQIEASRTGKLVLLHFYTSSCGPCKKLERGVFSQPQIAAAMERDFVPVKLNADEYPAQAKRFQVTQVPSEVVLTSQGTIVQKLSCPLEPDAYGSQLANVAQHYRERSVNGTASAQTPIHTAYAGLKITPPARPQVASASPVNYAPFSPKITKNPYVTAAPSAIANPVVQQRPAAPTVPANAMPNSYRDRYAAVATPASDVAKAPVTQAPAVVDQSPTTPPATPPVAAAAPVTAAPQVVKATPPAVTTPPIAQQAAAAPPVALEAGPPQLPPGTPPLAFDGCCPVSLQQAKKWVPGNKTFGAIHRGCTYLFAGEPQRQKFLAAPDAYSPVFSGNDPVKMLDENQKVAGSRKFGFEYRGAFYLFSSKQTMARFASKPDHYSAGVYQAMNRMDAAAGGTVRR